MPFKAGLVGTITQCRVAIIGTITWSFSEMTLEGMYVLVKVCVRSSVDRASLQRSSSKICKRKSGCQVIAKHPPCQSGGFCRVFWRYSRNVFGPNSYGAHHWIWHLNRTGEPGIDMHGSLPYHPHWKFARIGGHQVHMQPRSFLYHPEVIWSSHSILQAQMKIKKIFSGF